MDVAAWLEKLGLERYQQAFDENAIDFALLSRLTAGDLKEIGITAIGTGASCWKPLRCSRKQVPNLRVRLHLPNCPFEHARLNAAS